MLRIALILLLSITTGGRAQDTSLRILELEPTVLYPNQEPLHQVALLHLYNGTKEPVKCRVSIRLGGAGAPAAVRLEAPPGASSHRVLVPEITAPAPLRLEIHSEAGGGLLAWHQTRWQPQRRWKVYIIKSSHEDIGYEDYVFKKQHDIANFMDLARRLSGPGIDRSGPTPVGLSSYHYTMETLLFLRAYIEERSVAQWRELVEKDIKPGRMHLMGAPSGVHTHWMDYEELARMNYGARREVKDRYGLDLKTYKMVDNPSVSWSACQAIANAGFRYVARWGQGWRTGGNNDYRTTKLPALFWWVGPDGNSKVLFGWRSHYGMSFWFGQSGGGYGDFVALASLEVSRRLKAIERGEVLGPYPYDALINPDYIDHDTPRAEPRVLSVWNSTYRYPEIQIGNPTDFFEYIEKKYGDALPTLSGDLNNFSADYSSIDPDSQGWKRRAARLLPLAEGIAAIAGLADAAFLAPARLIDRTFLRLFDYDEHSWPTLPRPNDFHLFNAQWVKQREAERALEGARQALRHSFDALLRQIPNPGGQAVVVFNPLAHERTDLAEVSAPGGDIIDPAGGQPVPSQKLADGKLLFLASGVPAFGYKVFPVRPGSGPAAVACSAQVGPSSLSNRFYKIEFDAKTGAIRSILDKELNQELVDLAAPHRFNELVYLRKNSREAREGTAHSPRSARLLPGVAGPLRADFTVEIHDETTGAGITQRVILYEPLKRIDVVNELRHVKAFHSTNYEDRYRDNIYYAFPVKVDDFEIRVEYPGGAVRPYDDQLRWGSHDYLYANRWVNVGNQRYSVTMAPWEAGAVSFGEIRYNHFSIDYKPSLPWLYSYAYSNRMAELLSLSPLDWNATLRYSFTSHRGDWRNGATTRFGWSIASPLEARPLSAAQKGAWPASQASFAKISAPNVHLVTLKNSEQPGRGWVLRLVETEGKDTPVTVELPHFPVTSAMECDLVENDRAPLAVEGGKVRLTIGKHAFATVRVAAGGDLPAIAGLRAEALSDSRVRLSWSGKTAAASGYNIYRSDDPDDPPTAYTLVGRATSTEYLDEGLNLDTAYYYHVAAVSKHNKQGAVSARVAVRTKKQNTTAPAPVQELGVVRRAPDCLILYWRTSPEPDVARYQVYRNETGDFDPAGMQPLATLKPARYFLQIYKDENLRPGRRYYYKVVAEDWAGNAQKESPVAWAQTPGP